jgi:hypothetical protein
MLIGSRFEMLGRLIPGPIVQADWFPVRVRWLSQADWFPVRVRWLSVRGLRLVLIGSRFEGLLSAGFRADSVRGLRLVLIGSRFEGLLSAGFRADWFPEPEPNPEPGTESDDLGADWLTEPGTG